MKDSDDVNDLKNYVGRSLLSLIILSVLNIEGTSSGYSVIKTVKNLTGGDLELKAGTVYPVLENLKESGLVSKEEITTESRKRKGFKTKTVYRLTRNGITILHDSWRNWELLKGKLTVFNPENVVGENNEKNH